jgi:hypothetical protein
MHVRRTHRQCTVADRTLLLLLVLLLRFLCHAAESGVLQALEEGKSEEEAFKLADSGAVASVVERAPGAFSL